MGVVVDSEVVNSLYGGQVVSGLPFLVSPEHCHPGSHVIQVEFIRYIFGVESDECAKFCQVVYNVCDVCVVWSVLYNLGWSITQGSRFNLKK